MDNTLAQEMLAWLPLEVLRDMEQEAEREFRRAKTPQELVSLQQEWRAIETAYLNALKKR